jgi:hypothetical protein
MFPSVQTNISDLKQGLAQAEVAAENEGGLTYLTFAARRNTWEYGRDKEDVSGQKLHINSASFTHGWILWHQRKCFTEMDSIIQRIPDEPAPKEKPNGAFDYPSEARGFQGKWLDSDEIVQFESGTMGGRKAVDNVLKQVKQRAISGSDFIFPIVELGSYSYTNNNGDQVHAPTLEVVSWTNEKGDEEAGAALDAPNRRTRKV